MNDKAVSFDPTETLHELRTKTNELERLASKGVVISDDWEWLIAKYKDHGYASNAANLERRFRTVSELVSTYPPLIVYAGVGS